MFQKTVVLKMGARKVMYVRVHGCGYKEAHTTQEGRLGDLDRVIVTFVTSVFTGREKPLIRRNV